jgi:hypothetical protein
MLYEIFYQLLTDKYPTEIRFEREIDMESHYNIWVAGDDYHFCEFYYCNREYTPTWME